MTHKNSRRVIAFYVRGYKEKSIVYTLDRKIPAITEMGKYRCQIDLSPPHAPPRDDSYGALRARWCGGPCGGPWDPSCNGLSANLDFVV